MDQRNLTLDFVKGKLLDESNKRFTKCINSEVRVNEHAAMNTKTFKYKCYGCGRTGHKKSECQYKNVNYYDNSYKWKEKQANTAMKDIDEENFICFMTNASSGMENSSEDYIKWYIDSGASDHMVNNKNYFSILRKIQNPIEISVAKNGTTLRAEYVGDIKGYVITNGIESRCVIKNVLLVNDLKCNLLSIKQMEKSDLKIIFEKGKVNILRNGKTIIECNRSEKLYELIFKIDKQEVAAYNSSVNNENIELWHRRLGHLNKMDIMKLINNDMVYGISKLTDCDLELCEICVQGKQARKPFGEIKESRARRPLELIHSDVCGPLKPQTWNNKKYFVSFIDDYTHFTIIYLLNTKDEVFEYFQKYEAMVTAFFERKISRFRSDNGGEYSSNDFQNFCAKKGIQLNYTVPYSPQLNGVAERFNRTIIEKARTMLYDSGMSKEFWGEAVLSATYLVNRSPTRAFKDDRENKTPAELWYRKKPDLTNLKVFGSIAYAHVPKEQRDKLDIKTTKNIMIGYTENGYRLWSTEKAKIIISRDVIFNENKEVVSWLPNDMNNSGKEGKKNMEGIFVNNEVIEETFDKSNETEIVENNQINENFDVVNEELPQEEEPQFRRSHRIRQPPLRYPYDFSSNIAYALNAESYVEQLPCNITEAKLRDDWSKWEAAIKEEMMSLQSNDTWSLVKLPEKRKAIDCKWVFKIKRNEEGEIDRYKARLVAKGFTQRENFDYFETYAPVAKLTTVRILLAVANHENYMVHQMDVKTAFLNGILKEEIYMKQPEGFEKGDYVCKLNKSLYGLKQASRMWNDRFNIFILKIVFQRSNYDTCLYLKVDKEIIIFLLIYVDDLMIVGNDVKEMQQLKTNLGKEFEMKDLNELKYFLGIKLEREKENGVMKLSQKEYIINVLKRFEMFDCKGASTPMENGLKLEKGSGISYAKPYRELIGCLMYLMLTTRPDISASVNYYSRFQNCYDESHWNHLKRILRYLKLTLNYKLFFTCQQSEIIVGFADSDWANDVNDRKSTSGYVFKVFGSTVSWSTRKQTSISLSSTEAEYVALSEASREAIWLRNLLKELGFEYKLPVMIYEDNQSCIQIAQNPKEHHKMKHIDVRYNFIREAIQLNIIKVAYVPTERQLADIFTKSLVLKLFEFLRKEIGIMLD